MELQLSWSVPLKQQLDCLRLSLELVLLPKVEEVLEWESWSAVWGCSQPSRFRLRLPLGLSQQGMVGI